MTESTMTNKQALEAVLVMLRDDCTAANPASLLDLLDYLAIVGVVGANRAYLKLLADVTL